MSAVLMNTIVSPIANRGVGSRVRWAVGLAGLALLVVASMAASNVAKDAARFPVSNVDVLGTLDYADRDSLQQLIEVRTREGFYALDIDGIRHTLEATPWVSAVHVRRVWPARLSVDVEEHEPTARWNKDALLSKGLELFYPPQLDLNNAKAAQWQSHFVGLPQLTGATGRHEAVLDAFRYYQQMLSQFGVQLDALEEDERLSQSMHLSNDVIVHLGYEHREVRLQRFIDVYERLVTPLEGRAASFDMRYSNGFALRGGS
ncbi:MAG: FtsQ-type POTRA domain-containing protein [Granulosicoccaceae bacterium]